jgi:hypothetical protein
MRFVVHQGTHEKAVCQHVAAFNPKPETLNLESIFGAELLSFAYYCDMLYLPKNRFIQLQRASAPSLFYAELNKQLLSSGHL